MAINDYPVGPCPQCCRGNCRCGADFWKNTPCESEPVDINCATRFCCTIEFDYSKLPGGGLQPMRSGFGMLANCPNPEQKLPTKITFPMWCYHETGTPWVTRRWFTSGETGPCYPNYNTFNPGGNNDLALNPHTQCFNFNFDAGAFDTTQFFELQIPIEGGVWYSWRDRWVGIGPTNIFKIKQCNPLVIEGEFGNPGYNVLYMDVWNCDEFFKLPFPADQFIQIAGYYPGGNYADRITPCSVSGLGLNVYNCQWSAGGSLYPRVPMKITIKEWDSTCVEGREYNGKVARWWCTPAGCVQSVDPPQDQTAGPFNTKADCNEGCGTATEPDQPPGNSWWCIYGILVQGAASPHPDATGPFNSTTEANCGPAQMVWHCGETGPAKISRWEAVQRGFQYWATEQEVIDAGCVLKWYCGSGGCGSFTSPPIGSTGGPYDNEANCQASCQSGAVKYWCVAQPGGGLNRCVQSIDPPPGTVSGPFITSGQCFENCNLAIAPPPVVGPVSTQSAQIQRVTLPCLHLGDNLEDPATCGCGTAVLRSCAVHGQCRKTGYPKAGEAICLTCPDYQAPQTGQA